MKELKKILIPIDFSPVAKNAVQYANGIMEKHSSEVLLVYVNTAENPKNEQEIKSAFKSFEQDALIDVAFYYEFIILNGKLLDELTRETREQKTDLVIIGSKGARDSDLSLASALIRLVFCPVIVVPEHFGKEKIRKIAFANDYKPIRESEAIKPLWEFALEFQAKVDLLHVNNSKEASLVPADEAETTLEYYFQSLEREYVHLRADDMEEAISNYLRENDIDILAILSRDHGNNQLKSEGRLVAQLSAHSQVPVLVLC